MQTVQRQMPLYCSGAYLFHAIPQMSVNDHMPLWTIGLFLEILRMVTCKILCYAKSGLHFVTLHGALLLTHSC